MRPSHHPSACSCSPDCMLTSPTSPTHGRLGAEAMQQVFALRSGVANMPHPHKNSQGEDAFLLGPHMIGVADGVGSWWELGVDPALYARGLMHASCRGCGALKEEMDLRPRHVLHHAWRRMQATDIVGSSTACLVSLHPHTSELLAANVRSTLTQLNLTQHTSELLAANVRGAGSLLPPECSVSSPPPSRLRPVDSADRVLMRLSHSCTSPTREPPLLPLMSRTPPTHEPHLSHACASPTHEPHVSHS